MTSASPKLPPAAELSGRCLELCERNGLREYRDSHLRSVQSGLGLVGGDDRFRLLDQIADWGYWVEKGGQPAGEGSQEWAHGGAFVEEFLSLHEQASEPEKHKPESDLKAALAGGFAPLELQVRVSAWLRSHAYATAIADVDPARRSFDFLAERGSIIVEVECKSFSVDKGRKVTGSALRNLVHRCQSVLAGALVGAERAALLIEAKGRFPEDVESHTGIAEACATSIRERRERAPSPAIRVAPLPRDFPDPRAAPRELKAWARHAAGGRNVRVALMSPDGDALLVLVAASRAADRIARAIKEELVEAADKQLSRGRPGLVAVLLEGVRETELVDLATDSGLRDATLRVLTKEGRGHLRGVVYFADSGEAEAPPGPHGRELLAFRNPRPSPFPAPDPDDLLGPARKPTGLEPVAQA